MKKINTGISDFEDLIKSECIYVDKTAYMHRLSFDSQTRHLADAPSRRLCSQGI